MAHGRWGTEALWQQMQPLLPGLSIEVVARAESTNTQLLERARLHHRGGDAHFGRRAGDTQPCLLVAEHQTAGRGRLGRAWKAAPEASLTFSLALLLDAPDWSGLSLAVGVALADALDAADDGSAPRLLVKWPNDLLLAADAASGSAARKLGGVLIESLEIGDRRMAVIGVGLNVAPHDDFDVAGASATVHELHPGIDPPSVLARVGPPLAQALRTFERDGFAPLRPRFAARDALRGQRVAVLPSGPRGIADGVGADGALHVVADDGALARVTSGDVSVRLAAADA